MVVGPRRVLECGGTRVNPRGMAEWADSSKRHWDIMLLLYIEDVGDNLEG